MASVLVVATSKGGTGQTTIAASLAGYWRSDGTRIAVLDTDPSQAATLWIRTGDSYRAVESQATASEHTIIGDVQNPGAPPALTHIAPACFVKQSQLYLHGPDAPELAQ